MSDTTKEMNRSSIKLQRPRRGSPLSFCGIEVNDRHHSLAHQVTGERQPLGAALSGDLPVSIPHTNGTLCLLKLELLK